MIYYIDQSVYYIGFDTQYLKFLDEIKIHDLEENGLVYFVKEEESGEWVCSGYIDEELIKSKEEIFSIVGVENSYR